MRSNGHRCRATGGLSEPGSQEARCHICLRVMRWNNLRGRFEVGPGKGGDRQSAAFKAARA